MACGGGVCVEKGVVGGCVSRPLPAEAPAGAYAHTRRRTEKKNRLTLEGQSKRTEHMQAHIEPLELHRSTYPSSARNASRKSHLPRPRSRA